MAPFVQFLSPNHKAVLRTAQRAKIEHDPETRRPTSILRKSGSASRSLQLKAAETPEMPRWRVDFIGNVLSTPGAVEASDEKCALTEATKLFDITPTGRGKIVVTRINAKKQ